MRFGVEVTGQVNEAAFRAWIERQIPVMQAVEVPMEREAKQVCPVDTGRLRASITRHDDPRGLAGSPYQLVAAISTRVEYAPYVEARQPFLIVGLMAGIRAISRQGWRR